jgi:hypothetical protein
MVSMSWSQAELDALRRAYASGTLRVTYNGKTVEYGSADDLLKRIQTIESAIAAASGTPRPVAGYSSFGRGDR